MTLASILEEVLGAKMAEKTTQNAKQLMAIKDDLCYVWSFNDNCILAVKMSENSHKCTKLIPTETPLFDVQKLIISQTGRWICVWGSKGASVLEIPRRTGKNLNFVGAEKDEVVVHTVPIAERFFMCNHKIILQEAQFHPGSVYDGHLVTLTSDNTLRSFNLDAEENKEEENLVLSKGQFFGNSSLSVKGSLGETAVSFAFAPPVTNDSTNLWPVFILCGDGSVYFAFLNKEKKSQNLMGPLTMLPESQDNYGLDFCAILCLHPQISSPPILVLATSRGNLFHCIVLAKDDESLETASQISDWSNFDSIPVDLALYVYENVQLELSLLSQEEEKSPFDYPLLLSHDNFSPSRYFCSHKAGIHSVSLPMVSQLAELARAPEESAMNSMPTEQESVVQHLICTQLFAKNSPSPVQGLAMTFPPARLHCILSDNKVLSMSLSKSGVSEPVPLLCQENSREIKGQFKEPFDKHIANLLQRSTNNPLIKSSNSTLSMEECYEILARSNKVLKEEYILKQEKARLEIEKRVVGLKERKKQQKVSLQKLTEERFNLRDKAAQLSEKYEDLRDSEDNLISRIETVLNAIQRRLPVTSDSEVRMQRQLQSVERKVKDLTNALEQIKSKERYQMRQIKHSQDNIKVKREMASATLDSNQAENMKEVLRQDGDQIAEMVKRLNGLKKDVY